MKLYENVLIQRNDLNLSSEQSPLQLYQDKAETIMINLKKNLRQEKEIVIQEQIKYETEISNKNKEMTLLVKEYMNMETEESQNDNKTYMLDVLQKGLEDQIQNENQI